MTWKAQFREALHPSRAIEVEDEREFPRHRGDYRAAAVLVPITDRSEPGVIPTQRPDWLRSHAGQVAFPGGMQDATDTSLIHTALREAQEEVGIQPEQVQIIGVLPPVTSSRSAAPSRGAG